MRSLDDARLKRTPRYEGPALCTACDHRWEAVAPVGVVWLECPACHTGRGLVVSPPHRDDAVRVCDACGGYLFTVLERAKLECVGCATLLPGDYVNDDA